MGLLLDIYSLFKLKKYLNPGGKFLTTDADGVLIFVDGISGITKVLKTDADLDDTDPDAIFLPYAIPLDKSYLGLIRIDYYDTDDTTLLSTSWLGVQPNLANDALLGFDTKVAHTKITISIG